MTDDLQPTLRYIAKRIGRHPTEIVRAVKENPGLARSCGVRLTPAGKSRLSWFASLAGVRELFFRLEQGGERWQPSRSCCPYCGRPDGQVV